MINIHPASCPVPIKFVLQLSIHVLAGFIQDILNTCLNVLNDLVFETEVVVVAEVQVEPLEEVILLIELDVLINIRMVAAVTRHVPTTDAVALFLPPERVPQLLEDGDSSRDPRAGGAGRPHGGLPRAAHAGPGTMECRQCGVSPVSDHKDVVTGAQWPALNRSLSVAATNILWL